MEKWQYPISELAWPSSRRWCKLNLGALRGQFKSRHFPKGETIFLLFIEMSCNNWYETTWTTLLDDTFGQHFWTTLLDNTFGQHFWMIIWIFDYLLNRIRLDLDSDKFYWIQKIPKLWHLVFHTPNIIWPREIELVKLDCITTVTLNK